MKKKVDGNTNLNEKRKNKEKKGDWMCQNCKNLNFGFRKVCNRCQINREFPLFQDNQEQNYESNNHCMLNQHKQNVNILGQVD